MIAEIELITNLKEIDEAKEMGYYPIPEKIKTHRPYYFNIADVKTAFLTIERTHVYVEFEGVDGASLKYTLELEEALTKKFK